MEPKDKERIPDIPKLKISWKDAIGDSDKLPSHEDIENIQLDVEKPVPRKSIDPLNLRSSWQELPLTRSTTLKDSFKRKRMELVKEVKDIKKMGERPTDLVYTVRADEIVERSLSRTRVAWIFLSYLITFYIPDCVLLCWLKTEEQRQAFREKVMLCTILVAACLIFTGIYVAIPIILCRSPALIFITSKKQVFCNIYEIVLLCLFGFIGLVIVIKVLAALVLKFRKVHVNFRNKYVMINIPCYSED